MKLPVITYVTLTIEDREKLFKDELRKMANCVEERIIRGDSVWGPTGGKLQETKFQSKKEKQKTIDEINRYGAVIRAARMLYRLRYGVMFDGTPVVAPKKKGRKSCTKKKTKRSKDY